MSKLKFTNDDIHIILNNVHKGSRGHFICNCPYCEKEKHFYIKGETEEVDSRGNNKSFNWDCKKCGEKGTIYSLLKHLGLLLEYVEQTIDLNNLTTLKEGVKKETDVELLEAKDCRIPIGFKRVYDNEYLLKRGLKQSDFYKYEIGITSLKQNLKDYVIFLIKEENKCKGYVSRCTLPKNTIQKNKILRYINSKSEFSKLLFGSEELTKETKVVILVEGIFDKIRLDNLLNTDSDDYIKVLCTFGKKISPNQIAKILVFEEIKDVILFYDLDAINDTKKFGIELETFFDNVKIACLLSGKDPDESEDEDNILALNNLYSPTSFIYDKVSVKPLKV